MSQPFGVSWIGTGPRKFSAPKFYLKAGSVPALLPLSGGFLLLNPLSRYPFGNIESDDSFLTPLKTIAEQKVDACPWSQKRNGNPCQFLQA